MSPTSDSPCAALLGGKVASIRAVADPAGPSSLGALEIELKNGRIIHARPAGSGGCAILPGPARYEPRRWRDLTPDLPFAFARDAVVTLAEAVELDHKVVGLRLKFANGAQFVYDTSGGGPRLTTSIDEVSGARS